MKTSSNERLQFHDQYDLGDELGTGAFAVVKEGICKKSGQSYAIKIVSKSDLVENNDEIALGDEIKVLKELEHEHIIRLYRTFEEPQNYYLVMEKMNGGELFHRIVQKTNYNEKTTRDVCKVMFDALAYCHSKNIVHRDLKPENLLLVGMDNDSDIKIIDFGYAKKFTYPHYLTTQCGTPAYVAPEILKGFSYDTKVDMWSLGVIAYILLGGYQPFFEHNQQELFRKIQKGQYEFHEQYWAQISPDAKSLISLMLTIDHRKRVSAEQAVNHPWMMVSDADLSRKDLGANLAKLRAFNMKRKLRAATNAVIARNKMESLGVNFKRNVAGEDSTSGKPFSELYELGGSLGKGAFGVVRESCHCQTDQTYAVKIVSKEMLEEEDERALEDEISILFDLNHNHIVHLYDVFREPDYFYLVMEKMNGGELFDRIVKKKTYMEREARNVCKILFDALAYCHSKHVAHRDLKPENLLLIDTDNDSDIKIADFGFAKKVLKPNSLKTQCGTPAYVAPEILEGVPYGTQADMWSLGVIAYILLVGYPPFLEQDKEELFRKISKGEYKFHERYWKQISPDAKDLISSMLNIDPTNRVSAEKAMNHPWMMVSDAELSRKDLSVNLANLKAFNMKRKLRAATNAVIARNKMESLGLHSKKNGVEKDSLSEKSFGELREPLDKKGVDGRWKKCCFLEWFSGYEGCPPRRVMSGFRS